MLRKAKAKQLESIICHQLGNLRRLSSGGRPAAAGSAGGGRRTISAELMTARLFQAVHACWCGVD